MSMYIDCIVPRSGEIMIGDVVVLKNKMDPKLDFLDKHEAIKSITFQKHLVQRKDL